MTAGQRRAKDRALEVLLEQQSQPSPESVRILRCRIGQDAASERAGQHEMVSAHRLAATPDDRRKSHDGLYVLGFTARGRSCGGRSGIYRRLKAAQRSAQSRLSAGATSFLSSATDVQVQPANRTLFESIRHSGNRSAQIGVLVNGLSPS